MEGGVWRRIRLVDGGREGGDYRIPKNSEERQWRREGIGLVVGRGSFELFSKHGGEWRWSRFSASSAPHEPSFEDGECGCACGAAWWESGARERQKIVEMGAGGGIAAADVRHLRRDLRGRGQSTFCLPGRCSATSDPSRMRDSRCLVRSSASKSADSARCLPRKRCQGMVVLAMLPG